MRHSKFKNTGILFELLVQQITSDILKGVSESKAKNVLQKYFSENTYVGKELKLYQYLLNEKIKTSEYAARLLETVIDTRKKIPTVALSKEKYNLIKEIGESYNINDFLKGSINNYKVLASIYKIFENSTSKDIKFEPKEVFQAKNCLIEHIINKNVVNVTLEGTDKLFEAYKKLHYDEKLLTYKILVDSFNKKYDTLTEEQKNLLREYVNGSNTTSLKEYMENQIPVVTKQLRSFISKINDEVVKIKLNEAISQLNNLKIGFNVKDNHITTLMMTYELLHELRGVCK